MPPASPSPLPPPLDAAGPYRVCLVCLGNICRSPMAEVVLRAQLAAAGLAGQVAVDSAGTAPWHVGQPMSSRACGALARRGLDGEPHRARQFEAAWLADRDLVLAMDSGNLQSLKAMKSGSPGRTVTSQSSRVRLFGDVAGLAGADVPDPYGGNPVEFARVLDLLHGAMPSLVAQLARVVV
ncbi:MAG TPA: low molecular weight protein-tyrosine-phosphatase [Trebonia sp.]|nr:low molecular weight protein-tyrosine-phosphatase [Trebonia sp.]